MLVAIPTLRWPVVVAGCSREEGVADDQNAAAFADHLEGAGDRAHLRVVGPAEHVREPTSVLA
jgi:hypothetical protein